MSDGGVRSGHVLPVHFAALGDARPGYLGGSSRVFHQRLERLAASVEGVIVMEGFIRDLFHFLFGFLVGWTMCGAWFFRRRR